VFSGLPVEAMVENGGGRRKILLKGTESVGEQPELFSRREKNDFMRRGCEKVI